MRLWLVPRKHEIFIEFSIRRLSVQEMPRLRWLDERRTLREEMRRRQTFDNLSEVDRRATWFFESRELSTHDIINITVWVDTGGQIRVIAPGSVYYKFEEMLSTFQSLSSGEILTTICSK